MIASIPPVASPQSNPFATRFVRPGSLPYRFAAHFDQGESDANFLGIVRRLQRHRRGLIVGPHGSGKTTLIHTLGPWLRERYPQIVSVQLTASPSTRVLDRIQHCRRVAKLVRAHHSCLCSGGLLIVDGAEQLSRVDWAHLRRRVSRRRQTMLATSHVPLPGMELIHKTEINRTLVESLAQSLLANAAPQVAKIVHRELRAQDWTTLTNVRDFWFDLYDIVQPHIIALLREEIQSSRKPRCQSAYP